MSTVHQPACASLDQYLTLPYESLEQLKAVKAIDIESVIEQLKVAAESALTLHVFVESELPDASWQTRGELEALLAQIPGIASARSRLLALAVELKQGSIAHRRALRVSELHKLREKAIGELQSQAELRRTPPPHLPGPGVEHWIEWACGLKEPEDEEALQTLRKGFPALDDFVASVEPCMWVAQTTADESLPNAVKHGDIDQEVGEQVRSRLLALAMELERGSIVHHRTLRVNQLRRLREQAVNELRSHADSESPPHLPGPEAESWIEWACRLQEPESMDALQALRDGFARLDDFVANLGFDMWVAGPSSPEREQLETKDLAKCLLHQAHLPGIKGFEGQVVSQCSVPIQSKTTPSSEGCEQSGGSVPSEEQEQPAQEQHRVAKKHSHPIGVIRFLSKLTHRLSHRHESFFPSGTADEGDSALAIPSPITQPLARTWKNASLIPLAVVTVTVLALLGALQWKSNWSLGASFKVSEGKVSQLARGNPGNNLSDRAAGRSDHRERGTELQDQVVVPTTALTSMPAIHAGKESDGSFNNFPQKGTDSVGGSSPERHPLKVAAARESSPADLLETASVVSTGASSDAAVPPVPPAAQKPLVLLGGAQGLVIHGSAPLYPVAAKQAHIEGSVLLRAVIGKDGNAFNVRVLSGRPQLIQAALNAVKQWRFTPYAMDGEPVDAATQIDVKFTLQDN